MNVPRLLIEEGTAFEREILASSRLDVGSDEGFKRTLGAMGLAAATVSATSSTAGACTAAGLAAGSSATLLGGAGVGVVVKWIGLATLLVGSTTLSATWVARRAPAPGLELPPSSVISGAMPVSRAISRQPTPEEIKGAALVPSQPTAPRITAETGPPARATTPPARAEPRSLSVPPALAAAPAGSPAAEPASATGAVVESPPADRERVGESSPPSMGARSPSTLDDEVATLDRVRASLSAGDSLSAFRQLDAYDQACHVCVLSDEATVLRVDALMAQGDAVAAAALAQRFLAANPSSPHAPHLRSVVAGTQNP
jgi:hypothetical protein